MIGFGFRQKLTMQSMNSMSKQVVFKNPVIPVQRRNFRIAQFSPLGSPARSHRSLSNHSISPKQSMYSFTADNKNQPNKYDEYTQLTNEEK